MPHIIISKIICYPQIESVSRKCFFITAIIFFSFAKIGYSCDCPPLTNLSVENVKQYNLIFKGCADSISFKNNSATAWFTIVELYKGSSHKQIEIQIEYLADCQFKIEKGDEWIIYANYKNFGNATVSPCGRSRKYFSAIEDDYFTVINRLSYEDELAFLKNNLGVHPFIQTESTDAPLLHREIIHPSNTQVLIWLLFSLIGFLLIYYLFKKYVK